MDTKSRTKFLQFYPKLMLFTSLLLTAHNFAYSGEPVSLTILHTNDIHAQYTPLKATWLEHEPEIGGFEALSYYVGRERGQAWNSLLLDAGDLMTGSAICDIEHEGAYGGALITMMNLIGYDGMVPGNHEFDISVTNLRALENIADFPMVCANMTKGKQTPTERIYHIYEAGDLKVGVIGLTYHPMRGMVADPNLEGFDSVIPEIVVDSLVTEIDPLTDVVILLSHLGLDRDRQLARRSEGVDLIVGGHSHARLEEPESVNGVLIVQAGSYCRFLGRIDLTVQNDSISEYVFELIPMFTMDIDPDPEVSASMSHFESLIDERFGRVIGELDNRWTNEHGKETYLGDWLSDILRKRLNVDVGIVNSGGIRKSLSPGEITVGDIREVLPFDNRIVTFGCSGRQLLSIARQNISYDAEGYIYPLQISGMSCLWRETESGNEIVELLINGAPIDHNRVYHVASFDYVVIYNSERYFGYKVKAYIRTSYKLPQLVIDEIEKNGFTEDIKIDRCQKIN